MRKEIYSVKNAEKTSARTEVRYGVSLLKVLMCFEVVCCHFLIINDSGLVAKPFIIMRNWAVPIFMILSFIFCKSLIQSKDINSIKKRLKKLYWPMLGWTIIYQTGYFILNLFDKKGCPSTKDFIWQIVTGHSKKINPTMWFQTDLILLTIMCGAIYILFSGKIADLIIGGIGVGALFLQYSGLNGILFGNLRYEIRYPLGRLVEMIPCVSIAILIIPIILKTINKDANRIIFGFCLVVVSFLFQISGILVVGNGGYGYSGIPLLVIATGAVLIAYCIPLGAACSSRLH